MDQCGNYLIEDRKKIGSGAFGEVYECKIFNSSMSVTSIYARKHFLPHSSIDTEVKELADLRDRFIFEIKKQCEFNNINYNSIAPIVLFKTDIENPYFVMEKADCNLFDAIEKGLSREEKSNAVSDILSGLSTIHSNGYVHRDLKPQNILKYKDGRYKITDFGLLKDLDELRAEIKTKFNPKGMGTQGYIAPEVDDSGIFSVASDIYSMGKIINDIYRGDLPPGLSKVISRCCNYLPEDRYSDAKKLTDDFIKVVGVNV